MPITIPSYITFQFASGFAGGFLTVYFVRVYMPLLNRHGHVIAFAIGFVFFSWLATWLLPLVIAATLVFLAFQYRDSIQRAIEIFAKEAGMRFNRRPKESFGSTLDEITDDYLTRDKQVNSLPLEHDDIREIVKGNKQSYTNAVQSLTSLFPFITTQTSTESSPPTQANSRILELRKRIEWLRNEDDIPEHFRNEEIARIENEIKQLQSRT